MFIKIKINLINLPSYSNLLFLFYVAKPDSTYVSGNFSLIGIKRKMNFWEAKLQGFKFESDSNRFYHSRSSGNGFYRNWRL